MGWDMYELSDIKGNFFLFVGNGWDFCRCMAIMVEFLFNYYNSN